MFRNILYEVRQRHLTLNIDTADHVHRADIEQGKQNVVNDVTTRTWTRFSSSLEIG